MKYTPRELEGNVNISSTPPLKEFFILLAGILGVLIGLYIALGLAVNLIVPRIPKKVEQKLGGLFLKNYGHVEESPEGERLQRLLDDLVEDLPQDNLSYRVHLIEHARSNAMALPGGHILVFSGILEDVGSENGLAFVLSHELGHFANRDHLRGLGRGLVLWGFSAIFLGNESFITDFLAGFLVNVEMKFSQHQETMADLFALDLLNKRYGHVGGAESFFENICKKEKKGHLSYYFASHPHPIDRIETMEKHIQKMGYRKEKPLLNTFNISP
jgi:Zn-dependent protease with chaperone function